MNLSMKWLADYIDCSDIPVKNFCYDMTMSGSKVERYDAEGAEISKVVVGKLLSVVAHENSDHLVVCMVDVERINLYRSLPAHQTLKQDNMFL